MLLNKILIVGLSVYSLVAIVVAILASQEQAFAELAPYFLMYVFMPLLGVFSLVKSNKAGLMLTVVAFMFISIRFSAMQTWLPFYAPISMSLTFGDFIKGTGGLIDFFALSIVILLLITLRQLINNEKHIDSKPTE